MGEKLVIGPIDGSLRTDRTAFVIDDDSFPKLVNAYQWRGRVKRKRGTSLLGRLVYTLGTTDGSGNFSTTIYPAGILSGTVSFAIGSSLFTDIGTSANPTNLLRSDGLSATATLNRSTGALVIDGSVINTTVFYYPSLPVMGLEDLVLPTTQFPGTLAFDTDYAYNISTDYPNTIYNVNFFKNPASSGSYVAKASQTVLNWNGFNYQQFWTTNYQGALLATNGITASPITFNNVGMQYAAAEALGTTDQITSVTWASATTITFVITNCPLVIGDYLFANEFTSTTAANAAKLNNQTGYVTACNPNTTPLATKTLTVTFPEANIPSDTYTPGILQYLTNISDPTRDCIRWYDGDPTINSGINGWVNFMPPLSNSPYSISDEPQAIYYLVGARMIVPFKDRLLFLGPIIQTSSPGSYVYLQDTVVYSENGSPFYTASFTGPINNATTEFFPLLVPINQSAIPLAFFEDVTGFGGFTSPGVDQPITTVGANEDVLIIGFSTLQTRLVYSGDDIFPFNFFIVNSELGSGSTFSAIVMDDGVITRGTRGFVLSSQTNSIRIDTDILDQAFQIQNKSNGSERFCAQRDYINEWIYFTYCSNDSAFVFPTQTLQYNYRDDSWAIFNESYTTYGSFRRTTGQTWLTIATTWENWNEPWNAGESNLLQPQVIAGNQQGFVIYRDTTTTNESPSLTINNIVGNIVTCPNNCLNNGDYVVIYGCQGSIAANINGNVYQVSSSSTTGFVLNGNMITGTYLGGGTVTRMYIPTIMTKQFPTSWGDARKTRLGPQQYLFTATDNAQITLLIFLSQNSANAYNNSPIVPNVNSTNGSLIYSTILYTCPESTNLGLTPANINLQTPTAREQEQIWHRMNTSLIGDTVQIGFTMSDLQMRDPTLTNQFAEIELHSAILDVTPSQLLC
jgi:hypothetical protein